MKKNFLALVLLMCLTSAKSMSQKIIYEDIGVENIHIYKTNDVWKIKQIGDTEFINKYEFTKRPEKSGKNLLVYNKDIAYLITPWFQHILTDGYTKISWCPPYNYLIYQDTLVGFANWLGQEIMRPHRYTSLQLAHYADEYHFLAKNSSRADLINLSGWNYTSDKNYTNSRILTKKPLTFAFYGKNGSCDVYNYDGLLIAENITVLSQKPVILAAQNKDGLYDVYHNAKLILSDVKNPTVRGDVVSYETKENMVKIFIIIF